MSDLSRFSVAEKELLKLTPFWVFNLVAKAEGKSANKEIKHFKDNLFDFTTNLLSDAKISSQRSEAEISISILELVNASFVETELTLKKYPNTYIKNLTNVGEFVDEHLTKNEAQIFKQIIVNFALNIADSSGGWTFFKKSIGKDVEQTISDIKKALKFRGPFKMPF